MQLSDKFLDMTKYIRNLKPQENSNTIEYYFENFIRPIANANGVKEIIYYTDYKTNVEVFAFNNASNDSMIILAEIKRNWPNDDTVIYSNLFLKWLEEYEEKKNKHIFNTNVCGNNNIVTEGINTTQNISYSYNGKNEKLTECKSCGGFDYEKINNNEYDCKYCRRKVYLNG